MSTERPYEISHVPTSLHTAFDGHVPEATQGNVGERESNFLTRALAGYSIHKLADCTVTDAAAALVDGGGDGGIDAVYHSPTTNTLWLVQSKYIENGRGEPALGDVAKFKSGIEDLLQGKFDAFKANTAWTAQLPRIQVCLDDPSLRVRAVLVYSGINRVSEDRLRMFEDLQSRFSGSDEYLRIACYGLTSVHDWITGADEGPGVDEVRLEVLSPGWVKEPYETIYGLVRLSTIADLYAAHGVKLVAANIRRYKGNTDVNEKILATLREEASHFLYLNNGLTAYCERLDVNNLDRGNPEKKRITAKGFSIVNGAQTVGSVQASCNPNAPDGYVFIRIISLERCEHETEFARRITESTNFQNQIGARDFVALDEQQERIDSQLRLDGVEYHYKDSADVPPPDSTNFTLEEATAALACLEQEGTCDLCARVLANRNSLWSFDKVYPTTELYRSRYDRLFRPERSARTVWRSVQARREVIGQLQKEGRVSTGIRKAFFENARCLILNIVYLKLRPNVGEELTLTADEGAALRSTATEVGEKLWNVCEAKGFVTTRPVGASGDPYQQTRHFRSVFCAASDCETLRSALLAEMASAAAQTPITTSSVTVPANRGAVATPSTDAPNSARAAEQAEDTDQGNAS